MIYFGLEAKIVDVEAAFLYGKLKEEIYMECPQGMQDTTKDDVLLFTACIYGLVQAARQYYKKVVKILKEIGFTGGDVDPCLFCKQSDKGICFIALYVDDNLLVGHPAAIDDAIRQMRKHDLILKIEDTLHDYLSCELKFSNDRSKAWLGQPHLISNLEKTFGTEVSSLRSYLTPGTPGMHQIREEDPALRVSDEKHARYRSGVGMLLYLVKHSRPDIANCVRELSKVLDGPSMASYKEMLRCIKYVLDSKDMGLRIEPTGTVGEPWVIVCFTDSDHAGDPVTRRSVSDFIIYVHGVPMVWRSRANKCVALSSSESEWYALSEAIKEVLFLISLCESMNIRVQLPVTVRVDNVGTIFMSNNVTTTGRTRHIRTMFIREHVEDGTVKIVFVRSEDNDSDMMTKNVSSNLQSRHSSKVIWKKTFNE